MAKLDKRLTDGLQELVDTLDAPMRQALEHLDAGRVDSACASLEEQIVRLDEVFERLRRTRENTSRP
jgi:hypothetical protein